jgi:hypothetical protein
MKVQREDASTVRVTLTGDVQVPAGKIVIQLPVGVPLKSVLVNGTAVDTFDERNATVDSFPADVELRY